MPRKPRLSGQAAINQLERCLVLTELAEQRERDAQKYWFSLIGDDEKSWATGGCPDDYAYSDGFGLQGDAREKFLDWCANQRHYFLLCESGLEHETAHEQAVNDRSLLRGQNRQ